MLIGLTGPAGVGKDTVASFMTGYGFSTYAFARPLKDALRVLGIHEPLTREEKEINLPGMPFSYREAAQKLGTEFARELDQNFWLKLADKAVERNYNTVITDVRFDNEASWVRERGGLVVHIIGRKTTVQGALSRHASENGVHRLMYDVILDNSSNKEALLHNVKNLLLKDIPSFLEKQHALSGRSEFYPVDMLKGR